MNLQDDGNQIIMPFLITITKLIKSIIYMATNARQTRRTLMATRR